MIDNNRNKFSFSITAILTLVAVFGFGYYFGDNSAQATATTGTASTRDFDQFWNVWELIDKKHPGAEKTNKEARIEGAIKGFVASFGDPYTVYLNKEETKMFQDSISGTFSGVGMEIGEKDNTLTVIAPLKDTPAYKAGIKAGDKIIEIDGETTEGISVEEAILRIRGEKGTTVVLTVYREGEEDAQKFSIVRDTISVPSIETEVKDGVFVINLYSFSDTSQTQFKEALKEFAASKTSDIIIDLRGNPGGYLDSAVDVASWFVEGGKPIVIEGYKDPEKEEVHRSKGYTIPKQPRKVIILVDAGSASASEIVAGALKEYKLATIVGETTYGKGSVQEFIDLDNNAALKVTVAKWFTPNHVSISDTGVTPDIEVTEKPEKEGDDPVYDRALLLLK